MPTPLTPIFAALLNGLDAAYRRGVPLLSDAAFDRLSRMCPDALPPLSDLLSLDCPPDPADWLARNPGPYAVQLKADGVSINLIYLDGVLTRAHLRGGRDCTAAALQAGALTDLPGRPVGRVEVRCEAISLGRGASTQLSRNAVAAILRRNDRTAAAASLSLLAFDLVGIDAVPTRSAAATWLECAGFATLRCSVTHSATAVLSALETFTATQHCLPLTCDGLVVSLDSKLRQRDLGATSRAPRWSISLKP
jgi:DNA ligase (NAD+)